MVGEAVRGRPDSRKALFLANRESGAGTAKLDGVVEFLRHQGIVITPFFPDTPAQIPELIRSKAADADLVIIGGGDGTLNGCISALMETQRPLGILPMGTANDLARTLGIPADLGEAAAIIANGRTKAIDVGTVNGRPFFNVASIGLSAEIARFHRGERKRLLRLLSYPLSWIDAYKAHRPFRATVTFDGKRRRVRCTMIAVGNGRHYGGGLTISEDAAIDDAWLHVSHVKPTGLWGLASLLPSLRFGTLHRHDFADTWRAKQVEITTRKPKRINVDGELIDMTPATFSVRPKALKVLAPDPPEVGRA